MPKIIKSAKGSYTATDITVDSSGRVITASSGSGGQSQFIMTKFKSTDGNITHAINPATTVVQAFMVGSSGGGGTGTADSSPSGGGGSGLVAGPQAAPFSQPVTVGAGGAGRFDSGAATNYANFGTANGGQGGQQGPQPNINPGTIAAESPSNFTVLADVSPGMGAPGSPGSPYNSTDVMLFQNTYFGKNPGNINTVYGGPSLKDPGPSPKAGIDGAIAIYENIGS